MSETLDGHDIASQFRTIEEAYGRDRTAMMRAIADDAVYHANVKFFQLARDWPEMYAAICATVQTCEEISQRLAKR